MEKAGELMVYRTPTARVRQNNEQLETINKCDHLYREFRTECMNGKVYRVFFQCQKSWIYQLKECHEIKGTHSLGAFYLREINFF
ncbi:hypothetical protein [Peribacillus frigoritolerans]|uniref:hypothetical protein n=1 Tax=Peribacillus frigoritolerans TaxID=450367 RepID=UPI0033067648